MKCLSFFRLKIRSSIPSIIILKNTEYIYIYIYYTINVLFERKYCCCKLKEWIIVVKIDNFEVEFEIERSESNTIKTCYNASPEESGQIINPMGINVMC